VSGIDATLDGLLLERQDYADNHASHTARAIPCSCPFDTVHDLSGTAWRVCSRYGLPNSTVREFNGSLECLQEIQAMSEPMSKKERVASQTESRYL
jgi:hypothetical protein